MDKYTQKLEQLYHDVNVNALERKYGFPKHEILRLKEAFELFDVEQKGYLKPEELLENLAELDMYSKNDVIEQYENEGKNITFENFLEIFGAKTECKNRKEVEKLYALFLDDEDTTQNLNINHFQKIAKELELKLAANELEDMINIVSQKEEGEITFDEFYSLMMKYKANY